MNKSYITVWNEVSGSWVAAPEFASARGKRSKGRMQRSVAAALALAGVVLAGGGLS
ncbi:ESPR domain-containing protein, partial [Burkholderia sp. SRS-W-2-2016]|uniref:ESPR domain-containing protein n=1 Tax=Burkholderia sp. SRS-W-2-2016 TaxID=1926878 RepID=UPI000AB50527